MEVDPTRVVALGVTANAVATVRLIALSCSTVGPVTASAVATANGTAAGCATVPLTARMPPPVPDALVSLSARLLVTVTFVNVVLAVAAEALLVL